MVAVNTNDIIDLMTTGHSWEQVIYKIIAWEGLDPWDLDIKELSDSFVKYIEKLKELDFKIPAKYIMIASVLLRMKTDHLNFIEAVDEEIGFADEDVIESNGNGEQEFVLNPITMPPKRQLNRKVMITELISALRRVMRNDARRRERGLRAAQKIKIKEDTIQKRITDLYRKITDVLKKIEEEEIKFSQLVPKWEKKEVVNTFLPLVYLEDDKKVKCKQEEVFDEIYIKKRAK